MVKIIISRGDYPFAFYEVITRNGKIIAEIPLASVYGSETELDNGRFRNYRRETQPHCVTIECKKLNLSENTKMFNAIFNWMAENCPGLWSLDIDYIDLYDASYKFGFDDTMTAVLFAMIWK